MTADFPKITVITPSFNQGKYLEDTILSVVIQGYPNLEYIVVDGGSTDDSVEIIRKYEKHIAWWVSEKDDGLYHALQKGFNRSSGEIMAWINADDMYHKKCLFTVARIFQKFGQVNWLMGANTFYDEQGQPFLFEDSIYEQRWSKQRFRLFDGSFIQQESVFWRRDLWEKSGGFIDQNYSLAADFELWQRFFRHAQLYTTSYMLSGFRFRTENQKSYNQRDQYLQQVSTILKKENKDNMTLQITRIMISFIKIIPVIKWRRKTIANILQLPPKIIFERQNGIVLNAKK